MSIFYGIIERKGRQVAPQEMAAIMDALKSVPHIGHHTVAKKNVAFGLQLTPNTPESTFERMPRYFPAQGMLFVAKGRLDNRDDLIRELAITESEVLPDGEIMALTYIKWGEAAAEWLLGDWAFAAFHLDSGELFIARDHHGYTAIDYHLTDDVAIFSSNINALLALKRIPRRLNEDLFIRGLLNHMGNPEETCYRDIRHLPAGHLLKVGPVKSGVAKYWFPEKIGLDRGKNAHEHAEELAWLVTEATRARLRRRNNVVSTLSGGLDSSTVSLVAAELLAEEGERLTTFSHVPRFTPSHLIGAERVGDERLGIEAIVNCSENITPRYFNSEAISPISGIRQMMDIVQSPIHAAINAYWILDLVHAAANDRADALLMGEMGNATISFSGLTHLLPWARIFYPHGIGQVIKQKILRPLYFNYFRTSMQVLRGSSWGALRPPYARQSLFQGDRVKHALGESRALGATNYRDSRELSLAIMMPGNHPRGYFGALIGDHFGVELRDPLADKRVLEYVLTIPNECFFDERANGKQMVKLMMRDRLPNQVLFPKAKGLQSADIGLRLLDCKDEVHDLVAMLTRSPVANYVLDTKEISRTWEAMQLVRDNRFNVPQIHFMLRAMMIGLFLSRFD